jgi:Kef-type K+ transport system membrane component KefB
MNIFTQLSLIIVAVTVITAILRFFKQPSIIGYILTGLLVAPFFLSNSITTHTLEVFSEMGIAILLFIVGLHLSPKELHKFGASAFKIGAGQISLTFVLTFLLSTLLGYELVPSIYIATALSFSSTIVVLKLLSDKQDLEKLYGRLVIGVLLLQDIVAAIALILSSAFSTGDISLLGILSPFAKGIALAVVIFYVSFKLLPKCASFFAKSQELLFLFSLAWGFGLASLFNYLGLSMEIGALIAGVALSVSPYANEISSKLHSLREFFVVMFFILIGAQIDLNQLLHIWPTLLIFLLFIIVLKPFIIMFLMGGLNYKKKTSFFGATSLAQISEFSLILGLLGVKVGHISQDVLALLTLLAVFSIAISTYLIAHAEGIYARLAPMLGIFEKKKSVQEVEYLFDYKVVLFGCNRVGYDFVDLFEGLKQEFLCVDYDPDVIEELQVGGINCKYGDLEDAEFVSGLNLDRAKLVISTVPDFEANLALLAHVKKTPEVIVISISYSIDAALELYQQGADYVIVPHFIGGRLVAEFIEETGFNVDVFNKEKKEHVTYLRERKSLGHAHPGNLARFNLK